MKRKSESTLHEVFIALNSYLKWLERCERESYRKEQKIYWTRQIIQVKKVKQILLK